MSARFAKKRRVQARGILLGILALTLSSEQALLHSAPSTAKGTTPLKKSKKTRPGSPHQPPSADAFLRPFERLSLEEPPASPEEFSPDSGVPPFFPDEVEWLEPGLELKQRRTLPQPQAPPVFNPDPGANSRRGVPEEPFFRQDPQPLPAFESQPAEPVLPRPEVLRKELLPEPLPVPPPPYGKEPLPPELKLPRKQVRHREPQELEVHHFDYPLAAQHQGFPIHTEPLTNRWRIPFTPWRRYTTDQHETPYQKKTPRLWHPYYQSLLKGDIPVWGQDVFLNTTLSSQTEFEARRVPTPSAVSSAQPRSAEFFGRGEQLSVVNNIALGLDLFQGETAFKPVHWALRLQPVYNINFIDVRETTVVDPDPRGSHDVGGGPRPPGGPVTNPGDVDAVLGGAGRRASEDLSGGHHTQRTKQFFALQEAFLELHIRDLSDNYDFVASRFGNQPFISDFRGFVFNDVNSGARIFGNAANNLYQYNFALFDMREKDTYSELNRFDDRDQRVIVANLYRQDLGVKGFTMQWSFHANLDDGRRYYDRNGNIARPAPIGTVEEHSVNAYYLGWAGDGHLGRWNISYALYQAFGTDELNGLAGRHVDINAQMAALELSYDRDWVRYKASLFYASGDDDATDGTARGFDSIVDNPVFIGGPFSYYVRQGFNLAGTSVAFKQRNSLLPNFRTSKTEGQANFVNPGVFIAGLGSEIEVTPKLRSFVNLNYVRMMETEPIKTALLTSDVRHDLGLDFSLGFQYRPFLTDNVIVSSGFGVFFPGNGYRDIYRRSTDPLPGYGTRGDRGAADDFLYSGLIAVTLTY